MSSKKIKSENPSQPEDLKPYSKTPPDSERVANLEDVLGEIEGEAAMLSQDLEEYDGDERKAVPETDGSREDEAFGADGDEHEERTGEGDSLAQDGQARAAEEIAEASPTKKSRFGLSVALLTLILLAGDTLSPGPQETELVDLNLSMIAADRHVQSGHSTQIALRMFPKVETGLEYEWVADRGQIEGSGPEVTFIAPEEIGLASVAVSITDDQGNRHQQSIPLMIYRQFAILKADDLVFEEATIIPAGWGPYLEFLQTERIKASIGIRGESIEHGNDQFHAFIRALNAGGLIEFWNNGYRISTGPDSSLGEIDSVFGADTYLAQKADIERTQDLARAILDITLRAFGAPGNVTSAETAQAIEEVEDIEVWLLGDPSTNMFVLDQALAIGGEASNPSLGKFMEAYDPEQPYLVLEVHPDEWKEAGHAAFQRIVKFLLGEGVVFTTPYEYYQLVNSGYVTLLCSGCVEVDMQIPILNSPDGTEIVGSVPHNTLAISVGTDNSSGVLHYQVVTNDVTGWVSEWFVQEYAAP